LICQGVEIPTSAVHSRWPSISNRPWRPTSGHGRRGGGAKLLWGVPMQENRASNLLKGAKLVKLPIFKGVLAQKCRGIYPKFPS
jgi:hypothetical protein